MNNCMAGNNFGLVGALQVESCYRAWKGEGRLLLLLVACIVSSATVDTKQYLLRQAIQGTHSSEL